MHPSPGSIFLFVIILYLYIILGKKLCFYYYLCCFTNWSSYLVHCLVHSWWLTWFKIFLQTLLYVRFKNSYNIIICFNEKISFVFFFFACLLYKHLFFSLSFVSVTIKYQSIQYENKTKTLLHLFFLFYFKDMFMQICLQRTISKCQLITSVRTFKRFGEYIKGYGHEPKYYQGGIRSFCFFRFFFLNKQQQQQSSSLLLTFVF